MELFLCPVFIYIHTDIDFLIEFHTSIYTVSWLLLLSSAGEQAVQSLLDWIKREREREKRDIELNERREVIPSGTGPKYEITSSSS
jgi:hypothetical protein